MWTEIWRHVEGIHTLNDLFIYGQVIPRDFKLDKELKIENPSGGPDVSKYWQVLHQAASERLGIAWPMEKVVLLGRE